MPDTAALESIELFPEWRGDKDYKQGDRVRHNSKLYRCTDNITANPTRSPDVTLTHWEVVTINEAGTKDDPITSAVGMRYEKGKYYEDGGKIYVCTRDDTGGGTVLYYLPHELLNNYFEEVH